MVTKVTERDEKYQQGASESASYCLIVLPSCQYWLLFPSVQILLKLF